MADRTVVMAAILAKIQAMTFSTPVNGASTWVTVESRLRLWGDVPSLQQPYVALVTHSEIDEYRGLGLTRVRLELRCWCYTKAPKTVTTTNGQKDLDVLTKAFEAAFGQNAVDNFSTNQCTLGGLVYWCRIEGKVFKDPGDIDEQTLLIVPLVVEMP